MYLEKESDYFSNVRLDIVHFLKEKSNLKVLEVGGGKGNTLIFLKNNKIASEIHLVDIIDIIDQKKEFNSIHILDIEKESLDGFQELDVIILADVLEHLRNPEKVISKLKQHLKPGGFFIVSIPNIRHFSAFIKIYIKGNFSYEEQGIFDRTHLRFFCKSNMIELFTSNKNLQVEKVLPNHQVIRSKSKWLNKLTFGIFEQFVTSQYLLKVRKV